MSLALSDSALSELPDIRVEELEGQLALPVADAEWAQADSCLRFPDGPPLSKGARYESAKPSFVITENQIKSSKMSQVPLVHRERKGKEKVFSQLLDCVHRIASDTCHKILAQIEIHDSLLVETQSHMQYLIQC
ncbi:hypothetical protein MG293_016361 [Ovis ammon polii]|uniref:Uncharacterized protein n=1 Tax=Ovis ammon polii TaxID=230172 RepID=A0AAD4TSC5_OVIAM|nr:hypothetical protein MG293_016361 [Ovis ammon polii]